MSILGIAGGLLGGGGLVGIGLAIFAPGLLARIAGAVMNFVGSVNWAKIWWIFPIAAALVWGFIQRGEARHWRKVDAGHVALIAQIKAEVDRGVGQPTRADQAPIWIRRFVDNVNVLSAGLDRANAAALRSHDEAEQARQAAHAAAAPTPVQQDREKQRHRIVAGEGALKQEEWEQL